ncbi:MULTISPECIES: tetratricopeptide repeat protein [Psychrilyobacter]|uniref:Tetratricopeptide repeat protein n=1 Tax=Psychrilyobacter piezotolerans TaxID=2293438 RepID=A0ABX9KKR2_9FUSO|nr:MULTISPECIES: tetratricopeptide repeat protein [Psychrilyobacter]MCS5421426.1 tetratricopeptide repeat protein [Psychrilyobacter sp. S5]NDI76592.1 tetratricopeptide repeat protein [Psychrilyobacter piezotolerans]RDE65223.1 tetratricopeptide repeat protein [Psychrilyobacter sp. S5]REI42841.1 tetratricopeptide repeat protein [Psychrilyobacter piezotolerans]
MKKKLFILSLLIVVGSQIFATDRDDMKYIDKLYEAKEYSMAADELKTFVGKYPDSRYQKVALERLSKTLYLNKEYKSSATYFNQYLKLERLKKDEKNEAHYYLARNLTYLKDYNGAKKEINLIDKDSPEKIDAVYYLGISYYENGRYEEAKKTFKYLITKPARSKDALLYISLSSYNNEEYVNSTIYLDEYLKGDALGKNIELASYMYGMNQYKLGNNDLSIKKLTEVETNYPQSKYIADVRYGLLDIYLSTEDMEKAGEYYKKSMGGSNEEKANILLANYYFAKKNYENSLKYYELVKNSSDPKVIYGSAFSMLEVGESKGGIEGDKLVERSKKGFENLLGTNLNSEGIYYMALIDFRAEKYSEVIKDLKSYDESKMKREYRNNIDLFLGKSYFETKNYKKARIYYTDVYNRTQSKEGLYQLILVNGKLKDLENTRLRFEEYKTKFSTDIEYRQKIYLIVGNTYYKGGNIKAAKDTYKEYLRSYNDTKISENLITILVADGSYRDLITYLTPQPKTAENRYLLGVAYLGLTQYEKAATKFQGVMTGKDASLDQKEKASYNLIKTHFAAKNYGDAIGSAEQYFTVKEYKKYKNEVMDLEALSNFRLGKYSDAREIFGELGKDPKYKEYSQFQIAETYYNEGKFDLSFSGYNDLYEEDKKGVYARKSLYWGINILYTQGKYEDVIKKSGEFNLEYPESDYIADVNFYRADAYFKLNDIKSAAKTYAKIYQETTDEKLKNKTAKELTTLYYNVDDYENANLWKEKISDPNEKIYLSALIYEKQGKMDLAVVEYKKLTDNAEYGSRVNFNLAANYYKEKNYDEAKKYYENILKVEDGPYKDTATYRIGQIYFNSKDYSKALRNFMRIELLYEESSLREAAKLKIATTYEIQKEDEKAKRTYEEFYETYPQSKYRGLILEKLLVINLNEDKPEKAKKYYDELLAANKDVAERYTSYFEKKEDKKEDEKEEVSQVNTEKTQEKEEKTTNNN